LQLQTVAKKTERRAFGKPSVSQSKTILISWISFFGQEANFRLCGYVKIQNMPFLTQPHEQQYHPFSVPSTQCRVFPARLGVYGNIGL